MVTNNNAARPCTEIASDFISVIIPTFQRSDALTKAVMSVAAQTLSAENVRLIVVDNNPTPQERTAIQNLSAHFKHPIEYIHTPSSGLCNARNAGIDAVSSRYVAFLDDDMIADPDWLSALLRTSKALQAGIVFGPTHALMPDPSDDRNPYLEPLFSRLLNESEACLVDRTLGMGGCLMDLSLCDLPSPVFDPQLNNRGGEDDILFDALRRKGTRVGWSPSAQCREIVPEHRTTSRYVAVRNFGFGQGPVRIHASRGLSGLSGVTYFMAAGAVQFGLYGLLYIAARARRRAISVHYLARASQGLGKVFWGKAFSPELYGKLKTRKPAASYQSIT